MLLRTLFPFPVSHPLSSSSYFPLVFSEDVYKSVLSNADSSFCVNKPNLSQSRSWRLYGLSLLAILNYTIHPPFNPSSCMLHSVSAQAYPPGKFIFISCRSQYLISINDTLKFSSELGANNFRKSLLPEHQGYFCFSLFCHIPPPVASKSISL